MHYRSLLLSTVILVLANFAAPAEEKVAAAVNPQLLKAKTDYCKTCHGLNGQGFRGSFPMPRLAEWRRLGISPARPGDAAADGAGAAELRAPDRPGIRRVP